MARNNLEFCVIAEKPEGGLGRSQWQQLRGAQPKISTRTNSQRLNQSGKALCGLQQRRSQTLVCLCREWLRLSLPKMRVTSLEARTHRSRSSSSSPLSGCRACVNTNPPNLLALLDPVFDGRAEVNSGIDPGVAVLRGRLRKGCKRPC